MHFTGRLVMPLKPAFQTERCQGRRRVWLATPGAFVQQVRHAGATLTKAIVKPKIGRCRSDLDMRRIHGTYLLTNF